MTRVRHDHHHETQDIIDPETNEPITPGGPGGAASLEAVLTEGNETGENTIVMPMGTIDGTTSNGWVSLRGAEASAGVPVVLIGGDAADAAQAGGGVSLYGGSGNEGNGAGVTALFRGSDAGGEGGSLSVFGGGGESGTDAQGGDIGFTGGDGDGLGSGGSIQGTGGDSGDYSGARVAARGASVNAGGDAELFAGDGADNGGARVVAKGGNDSGSGDVEVTAGDAGESTDAQGGDITLTPGAGDGAGRHGQVIIGEAPIVLPMGTIDGTTDNGEVDIKGVEVEGGQGAALGVQPGSGGDGGTGVIYAGNSDAGSEGGLVEADGGLHTGAGGRVLLRGGHAALASDADGGDITLTPGAGDGAGRAGQIVVNGQVTLAAGTLIHGADSGADGIHADLLGGGGDGDVTGVNGAYISAGGGRASGQGGEAYFQGGNAKAGSDARGGDFYFESGVGDGAGRNGLVFLNLPTSDPHVAGALWASLGIVTVSAG